MSLSFYMDAEITQNRSLSQRGFITLISIITVFNCASAAVFIAMGAHLVPIFLGLDLMAVVAAFLASFQAAKRVERVQVTAREVSIIHETPRWRKLVWRSPTAFTRVALEVEEDRAVDLKLALSGREVSVAQALSPLERQQFAQALESAIHRARSERG